MSTTLTYPLTVQWFVALKLMCAKMGLPAMAVFHGFMLGKVEMKRKGVGGRLIISVGH